MDPEGRNSRWGGGSMGENLSQKVTPLEMKKRQKEEKR